MTGAPDLSRRWFLASLGSLAVASGLLPPAAAEVPAVADATGGYRPAIWYVVHGDGRIVVSIPHAEMGQHVGTALARIVADELEARWDDVAIVHVDPDPKWGYMITGGSWSVNHNFVALSRAGAAGRIAMIEAGAAMLGVAPGDCTARDSIVSGGGKSVSYGEIVAAGRLSRTFEAAELEAMTLKPVAERRLIGQGAQARDIPAKVNGTAIFGIDRKVEGMVHARPVMPPSRFGNSIASWSDAAARSVPGYIRTVEIDDPSAVCQGWLVVVADTWPAAAKAVDLIEVEYVKGPATGLGEAEILAEGHRLVNDPEGGTLYYTSGDLSAAAGDTPHEAVYVTHTAMQMPLEPLNALAWQEGDVWHIHCGDQHPSNTQGLLSAALGVPVEKIALESSYLGGGFGRRLYADYAVPAALTARAIGRPVKLVFSRPDDSHFSTPRSPSVQRIRTTTGADGRMTSYWYANAAGLPTKAQAPGFMGIGVDGKHWDPFGISGADHWYDIPNQTIRTAPNLKAHQVFVPGYLRSVSPGYAIWAVESHIDEVAHRVGRDPVEFRLAHLGAQGINAGEAPNSVGGAARLRAVVERAAAKTGWAGRDDLPDGEGMGCAIAFGQERSMPTWSATVAHVAVDRVTGAVRARRLTTVVDAGIIVDPGGALAQVEGGTLWGLSLALHEATAIRNGLPEALNYDRYTPVRMPDVPEIDIEFLPSDAMPVGLGEPGVVTVGPAIANAIFHAVGARVRELPIRPETVLAAMEV